MASFKEAFTDLVQTSRQEFEETKSDLDEVNLLIRQTEAEIERLTQRSNQAYSKLREIEASLDNYSRADIRAAYTAASEGQLRLLMMQSQLEQLHNKADVLQRLLEQYRKLIELSENSSGIDQSAPPSQAPRAVPQTAVSTLSGGQVLARIIQAQEDERNRVAKAIHDGPAQSLANVVLRAEVCEKLMDVDPSRVRSELSMLKDVVAATLQDTRRFIFDVRPMVLDDLGLVPTLKRYVQGVGERQKLNISLVTLGTERRFPNYIEAAVFRIIQEAIENAIAHANPSRIQVTIDTDDQAIRMAVEDDGAGFDAVKVLEAARERKGASIGIASILERVEILGGKVDIASTPGLGTSVRAEIPNEPSLD